MSYSDIITFTILLIGGISFVGIGFVASIYSSDKKFFNKLWKINGLLVLSVIIILGVRFLIMEILYSQQRTEWDVQHEKREQEKASYEQKMAEGVVELSFMGFELGTPFSSSIQKARSNKDIKINNTNINKIDGSITFQSQLSGISVECKVCSFQDTITSLLVITKNSNSQTVFTELYIEKYGDPLPSRYTPKWIFKNGSIEINTGTISKKRIEMIPGREHLSPTNLQNYREVTDIFFEMLCIIYTDFDQKKKVEEYEVVEQLKADSLKRIENEKSRKIEEQKKQLSKSKAINSI